MEGMISKDTKMRKPIRTFFDLRKAVSFARAFFNSVFFGLIDGNLGADALYLIITIVNLEDVVAKSA